MNTLTELIARHTRAAKDALAHYGDGCVLSIDAAELLALCEAADIAQSIVSDDTPEAIDPVYEYFMDMSGPTDDAD